MDQVKKNLPFNCSKFYMRKQIETDDFTRVSSSRLLYVHSLSRCLLAVLNDVKKGITTPLKAMDTV